MKALSIHPNSKEIKEIEIQMQANTVYSFFNSILIDELISLKEHIIYCDSNALKENKTSYFLGEQLIIGDALILGRDGFNDLDVSIKKDELNSLIRYDVSDFYKDVLCELSKTDINLYRTFEIKKDDESIVLNTEWVLYTFNIADNRTKEYFLSELKKEICANKNIEAYMQKMATLAMNVVS
jgi:hypothetical protein